MARSQRFRGVRQRHWGSWVSEIRHPLLKTRVWLGTFESAEDAAKAYDEAARLMSGPQAKTNFPFDPKAPLPSTSLLSSMLKAKIQRCFLMSLPEQAASSAPSASKNAKPGLSLTCLRLDTEKSNLGIWQKKGGRDSKSNWVVKLQLDNDEHHAPSSSHFRSSTTLDRKPGDTESEDLIASQMIEELLGSDSASTKLLSPSCSSHTSSTSSGSGPTSLHYLPGSAATASSCAPELTLPFLKNDLWDHSGEALMDNRCNSWYADSELPSPNYLPFTADMVMASQAYAFSSIIGS